MNTAAPNPAYAHTQAHAQDATHVRTEAYAAERISAQEAMKGMRITDPAQNTRRRKSSEIDEAYIASRVDRHLASRAQSVRESSKPYDTRMAVKEIPAKAVYNHATVDRKRSKADTTAAAAAAPSFDNTKPAVMIAPENHHHQQQQQQQYHHHHHHQHQHQHHPTGQENGSQYRQPHSPSHHSAQEPMPQSPATAQVSSTSSASTADTNTHQPASGRQSRMSNASSSKESYKRKYGELPGYSYIGAIGQGNFGKVLLAENDTTGEQVAVKILEKAQFKSEQQRLHATREARLMATLRHPNIVDVKTVLEDDARILIVMENLTGGELFDYISNKGSLDEKEARRIFHQIVLAIHYCHENNVVHRDLKPENILLDSDRNVRVADFGFGNNWHKDRHLTTYCGSPFYAAPEMVSGTPYIGPETDVWSLGVILYVLVCGRLPFDASDLPQLFAQIKRGNYQKPREGSIDVCSLIHRMLTVDPKRRATLSDVLRSRWMRAEGMESMITTLPALSTAPNSFRPTTTPTATPSPAVARPQPQARSTALPTYHPNEDISHSMASPAPAHPREHHRHSYHPPGAHDARPEPHPAPAQQQRQHAYPAAPPPVQTTYHHPPTLDQDDQMSDVSAGVSPTETMATISPSTPAPSSKDALLYRDQKRSNPSSIHSPTYEEKHHPYRHSVHGHARSNSVQPETVLTMSPSTDTLMDTFDSSSKKKRKALTKLRQFFRFENKV